MLVLAMALLAMALLAMALLAVGDGFRLLSPAWRLRTKSNLGLVRK